MYYKAERELGQNFISNPNITDKICSFAEDINKYHVVEVGPGPGILTKSIIKKSPLSLTIIELDKKFLPALEDLKDIYSEIEIINDNALLFDWMKLENTILISNLPYNITSNILLQWVKTLTCKQYVITIQKEYGQKILAKPGDKNYCSMNVIIQTFFEIKKAFIISKNSFSPAPKVDGIVLSLKPKNIEIKNKEKYLNFIKQAFFAPRKKLINNINQTYNLENNQNIASILELRPDNTSYQQFIEIYNSLI